MFSCREGEAPLRCLVRIFSLLPYGGHMRFALVDGQRRTAEKGLIGICPACGGPVLAKCGEKKAHHWAHKRQCSDTWATGKETDWHLDWKNCFPEAWQERILKDTQSGEKHIADILTEHNLVLEFQHSPIDPEERRAREYFYSQDGRRMAWVVDIREKKNDQKRCESYILRECPAYTLLYQFSPKDTGQSKVK